MSTKNLTKATLVNNISEKTRISKKDVKEVLTQFEAQATRHLKKADNKVTLPGFLSFASKKKEAREARNPATGDKIQVPAQVSVSIKAGKTLKEAVKGKAAAK